MKQFLVIAAVLFSLSASAQKKPLTDSTHKLVLVLNEEQVGKFYQLFGVGLENLPESEVLSAKQANVLYPFGDSVQRVLMSQLIKWHPEAAKKPEAPIVPKDSTKKN